MIGSSTLLGVGLSSGPAYRTAALLRLALLRSAAATPKEAHSSQGLPHFNTISELFEGPVRVTYPHSFAAHLGALSLDEDAFTGQRELPPGEPLLTQADEIPQELSQAETAEESDGHGSPEVAEDTPPAREAGRISTADMRALAREFQRRQHHANLLVAGGLASAFLLTLGGLLLLASVLPQAAPLPEMNAPASHPSAPPPKRATSIAWHQPARGEELTGLQYAYVTARGEAKAAPAEPRRKEM
jgi:hypothetical protein